MNQTGQPSGTAILVAAARALGAREPDPTVRNPDWLAERLLGPEERALLGDHLGAALSQPYEAGHSNMEFLIVRLLIPRTHFIDSRLEKAVQNGIAQVLILGTGFDTRAYTYEANIRMMGNIDLDKLPEPAKQAVMRFRRLMAGEPWVFGVPDNAEEEFLSGLGLELRKVMGLNSAEAVEKYLTRADGTVFGTFPATGQQGYLILEAAVPG